MKLAWLVALVLMMIGFAILFRPPRIDETMAPAGIVAPAPDAAREDASDSNNDKSMEAPATSPERASIASASQRVVAARTHASGRCIDERGDGLAGVEITLESVGERWSRTESAPFTLVDGRSQFRFRARSASDGRFTIDVPTPDAPSIELVATPDDAHLQLRRTLEHVLRAGDIDLGDLLCDVAGRIAGVVHTASGEPVAGVTVTAILPPDFGDSASDDHGHFAMGRLRAGTWHLQTWSERYLFKAHPPVEVHPGGDPVEVEIVADPAPLVSGRVVDTEGAPIAGATVAAYRGPSNAYDRESVFSGIDGRFELYLQSTSSLERLRLNVSHAGFRLDDPFGPVEPNASDIVVVMKHSPSMTIRVVDGASGTPVTRYRIFVAPRLSFRPEMSWWIEAEDRPRGEAEVEVAGDDEVVMVSAEGRARLQERVAPDEPGGRVQTLRMFPGGSIVGRATRAGAPASGVGMQVADTPKVPILHESREEGLARMKRERSGPDAALAQGWVKRDRAVATDEEGRFRFDELAEGSWTVTVRGMGIAPRSLDPVRLAGGSVVDLGDVAIDRGGSIEGHVLVPEGLDAHFERITLDGDALFVNAGEDGKYRFEGIEPGKHVVEAQFNKLLGLSGLVVEVDLADAEQRVLDLDLRESAFARVHVRVVRDRQPLARAEVEIESKRVRIDPRGALTNEVGEADLLVAPRVPFCVVVKNRVSQVIYRGAQMTLDPGQHADLDIAADPGRLEIVMPDRIQPSGLYAMSRRAGGIEVTFSPRSHGKAPFSGSSWTSNRISAGELPPGDYTVVAFRSNDTDPTEDFRFESSAHVDAGLLTVVDFTSK